MARTRHGPRARGPAGPPAGPDSTRVWRWRGRPFARARQRDERERRHGPDEDEAAARLEGVAADRRQPVRPADGPPGQDTPDEHDQGAHRGEAPAAAERTAVHTYSPL